VALFSARDDGTLDSVEADLGLAGTVLNPSTSRPDFTLRTTEGEPYDFADETKGKLTLLFFGYTSCPDVCPIHLATLTGALERPGITDPIVVFVSIDPARDTPEGVRRYLDRWSADYIGLVGTPEELKAAQDAAGVAVAVTSGNPESDDYTVGHASQILAFTPDDRGHVVYPFGARRQDWVNDLPKLATIDWPDDAS
jgi:protein SCO1/2